MSFETPDQDTFPTYYQPEASDGDNGGDAGSEPELPPDDAIEAAAMTAPDGWGDEESADNPPPAGGDGGDNGPPTDVPAETAGYEPEPERGEALKRVFDYASVTDELIGQEIENRGGIDREARRTVIQELQDRDATTEEILEAIGAGDEADETLEHAVIQDELLTATVQYGEDLEKAGLTLTEGYKVIETNVANPDAYIAALRNKPDITDETAQNNFDYQSIKVTKGAMGDAAFGLLYPGANEAQQRLADALPERGQQLADTLRDIDAPEVIVEAAAIMGTANREGLEDLWARGYEMHIIGSGDMPMGTDRLTTEDEWVQASAYLNRLATEEPDADFTREVYGIVLRDARQAVDSPAVDITEEQGLDPQVHADRIQETIAMRNAILGMISPTIREHMERLNQVAEQLEQRRRQ